MYCGKDVNFASDLRKHINHSKIQPSQFADRDETDRNFPKAGKSRRKNAYSLLRWVLIANSTMGSSQYIFESNRTGRNFHAFDSMRIYWGNV
jgi:hypothetical protein